MGEGYSRAVEILELPEISSLKAYAPSAADRSPFTSLSVEDAAAVPEYFAGRRDHDCHHSLLIHAGAFQKITQSNAAIPIVRGRA